MSRKPAWHTPDITMDRTSFNWPACGTFSLFPYITSDPDNVTCQRARCQETARIARRLYEKPVVAMSPHEQMQLRRLLWAPEVMP